jgi:hypothetical protein
MRHVLILIVASVALLVPTSLASACINDRESEKSEKEFKSRYIEVPAPTPQSEPAPSDNSLVYGGTTLGVGLLVCACALCVTASRRQE